MSFSELKVAELREVAELFAVDLDNVSGKANIIKEIEENGVTWEMAKPELEKSKEVDNSDAPELEPVDDGPKIVVRMTRQNPVYEVLGVRFTKEHPFAAVSESVAQDIFDFAEGFRPATPRELQEYYS